MKKRIIFVLSQDFKSKVLLKNIEEGLYNFDIKIIWEKKSDKIRNKIKKELYGKSSYSKILILIDYMALWLFNKWSQGLVKKNKINSAQTYQELHITSINASKFIEELNAWNSDLIINFGTSIYSGKTLGLIKAPIYNVHTGILPNYRNVYSEFWALVNKDYSNLGTTIFLIDSGIDKGPIISVKHLDPQLVQKSNLKEILMMNLSLASESILEVLNRKEVIHTYLNMNYSHYYRTPTLKNIIDFFLLNRKRQH
jgi:folate-dependent phosphoribosylglycinamide formyltransferase PurN